MQQPQLAANPFAQMMDPGALFAALERSICLSSLTSRICRPLDKPLIGHVDDETVVEIDTDDAAERLEAVTAVG